MGQSFRDSERYASLHAKPQGPGDNRPTSLQILDDNDVIGRFQDQVFLVTGGSNGIGVDEVKSFARTGARVFFTSRDLAKGEGVRDEIVRELRAEQLDPRIDVIQMDLMKFASVRKAAAEFRSRSDKLNVLVNNAGIAMTPHVVTENGFEQQFQVNHLSHFLLFHLLKDMLLASSTSSFNSRVIVVASSAHTFGSVRLDDYNFEKREGGYDPTEAYAQSKTANIWMSNELERRYGSRGVHSISVHPGGIETGLQNSHDAASAKMIQQYLQMPHIRDAMKSVEQGSASVVLAAIGKQYEGVGGFYMEDCGISPPMPDDAMVGSPGYKPWAYDVEGEMRLWTDSLKMVDVQED